MWKCSQFTVSLWIEWLGKIIITIYVNKISIPKWATQLYENNEEFYKAALVYYYTFSATPYLAKYFTGFLLKDILDRLTRKVEKTLSPDRKFWVYSSHDLTVFGFMNSLGISDVCKNDWNEKHTVINQFSFRTNSLLTRPL